MAKTAVVLFNLGGPDSLSAVQPFLENLFNDPDIFKLPFQKSLAHFISTKRAPKVQEEYRKIGGKSPLGEWTEVQRSGLEKLLRQGGLAVDVFVAMRYWHPLTHETVKTVSAGNYEKIILLPLYPHFSSSTTGSSVNEWFRHFAADRKKVVVVRNYQALETYLAAVNQKIDEGLQLFPESRRPMVQLVFSAHGTPVSYLKKGDPYSFQIQESVAGIMRLRSFSHAHHLCFQSKVGPMKWLEPGTDAMIRALAAQGHKDLLIIPISFVSDHVETLFELAIEYKHVADSCHIENYVVMPGLNDSALYVNALRELVMQTLNLSL